MQFVLMVFSCRGLLCFDGFFIIILTCVCVLTVFVLDGVFFVLLAFVLTLFIGIYSGGVCSFYFLCFYVAIFLRKYIWYCFFSLDLTCYELNFSKSFSVLK